MKLNFFFSLHSQFYSLSNCLKKTHGQDRRSRKYYFWLAFDMFDQLMDNSRIVFTTLNTDAKLDAKEYHLKIA